MPSAADEKAAEEDDAQDPPRPQPSSPQQPQQPPLSQMTMHVYPFPHTLAPAQQQPLIRAKRRQVKNACTNCQKACKKCDDARPCLRCVKYGISDDCVDSQRKERRRGVKRGPYKKRDGKGSHVDQDDMQEPVQTASAASVVQPLHAEPSNIPGSCPPIGYPQGFYNHYPPIAPKQAESICTPSTQPYFLASVPQFQPHLHPIHGPESHGYLPQAYYTAIFPSVSYHPPQPQLIKPDNPSAQVPDAYPMFSVNCFPRQSVGGQNEMVHGPKNERPGLLLNKQQ